MPKPIDNQEVQMNDGKIIEALPPTRDCGNHGDRFPCMTCGAKVPVECPRYSTDYANKGPDAGGGEDEGPCTDCWDTGVCVQTERPCTCQGASPKLKEETGEAGDVELLPLPAGQAFMDEEALDRWRTIKWDESTGGMCANATTVRRLVKTLDHFRRLASLPSVPVPDELRELVADAGASAKLERLRDSQGLPCGDRIEVDFGALIDVLSLPLPSPEGWVLVPREPSEAMIEAAVDSVGPIGCCTHSPATARETYHAMLSALPDREVRSQDQGGPQAGNLLSSASPMEPVPVSTKGFDQAQGEG